VRKQVDAALADDDLRWALELASWLVRVDPDGAEDRGRLASALRAVGQRTTAANIRNWCLTRALELDGLLDVSRFRRHRFPSGQVTGADASELVHILRVTLDPARCGGAERHLRVELPDGAAGLHIRNGVAATTDGDGADIVLQIDRRSWGDVLNGRRTIAEVLDDSVAPASASDPAAVIEVLSWFDLA
jgi:alkyl sulfatase BDS1-like metallo-beta-lactamase superfamily hydrolase